jgi:uncharacterized protein (DUF433 family)
MIVSRVTWLPNWRWADTTLIVFDVHRLSVDVLIVAPINASTIGLTHPTFAPSLQPMTATTDYRERIVLDPKVRFGKPVVRGTRVTVGDVLGYLAGGMSESEILADFPQLTRADILACLGFAADRERRLVSLPGV